MAKFEVRPETVWRLFRDGEPVINEHGEPVGYATEDAAWDVAANWDIHRAPTYAELAAMSDEELRSRALGGWPP